MGRPAARVQDCVVEVAVPGGALTAGPAARQVAAAHEISQRFGGAAMARFSARAATQIRSAGRHFLRGWGYPQRENRQQGWVV